MENIPKMLAQSHLIRTVVYILAADIIKEGRINVVFNFTNRWGVVDTDMLLNAFYGVQ